MAESWTIGSAAECDIVVASPTVSGRHVRLTREGGRLLVEDLRSTNGTFVNGVRVSTPVVVSRSDRITLGQSIPFPWPDLGPEPEPEPQPAAEPKRVAATAVELAVKTIRIGREPDNDVAIANPVVSGRHARLIWDGSADHAIVEDLGSSNGTAIGAPDRKIQRGAIRSGDTLYLGSLAIPADTLLVKLSPTLVQVPTPKAAVPRRALGPGARLGILVGQIPLLAGVVLVLGGSSVAARLSWLGLAAIWCGLADALVLDPGEASDPPLKSTGLRSLQGLGLAVGQSVALWLMVAAGAGFQGATPVGIGLLLLGVGVGLGLGLAGTAAGVRPAYLLMGAPILFLGLWLLGGEVRPLPSLPSGLVPLAQLAPSRWVFEGLLLSESAGQPDLAEAYFPADTQRMGPRAAWMALGAMLIGLFGFTAFLKASPPEASPAPGSGSATLQPSL